MITYVDCDEDLKKRIGREYGVSSVEHVKLEDDCSFVALDDEEIVGFVSVYSRKMYLPLEHCSEGYINIITVSDAHRRRRVARRLLAMCSDAGRRAGFYQLRAWSSDDNIEAIKMWQALGFGLTPIRDREINGVFATLELHS